MNRLHWFWEIIFFFGNDLINLILQARKRLELSGGGEIFSYRVRAPERYGVVEQDEDGTVISIEEKPKKPKSSNAVVGLYFYDPKVVQYTKQLKPSQRGELEITDLNQLYLEKGMLRVSNMGRGYAWLDTGTPESLLEASVFVQTVENRQRLKICCPEEISIRNGWMNKDNILKNMQKYKKTDYYNYLSEIELN